MSATLHVYVNQTDRGELVIGSEIDPYASYSHALDAAVPGVVGARTSWSCCRAIAGRQGAAPVGRHLRHDARLQPDHGHRAGRRRASSSTSAGAPTGSRPARRPATNIAELIATGQTPELIRAVRARAVLRRISSSARRRRRRSRTERHDVAREAGGGTPTVEDGPSRADDGSQRHGAARARSRERLRRDGIDYMLAQWVDIHGTPRVQGRAGVSALRPVPRRQSAGFAGAATVGMGQGPHSHDLIGMPDLATYTLVPWETGVARVRLRHRGRRRAVAVLLADGPPAAIERLAGDRLRDARSASRPSTCSSRGQPDGSIAPFDPSGVDTLEKPCYDFKGLSAQPRLPARADPRTWRGSAGSRTRPTTRTAPPSSSSTGSTPTRSRRPTATRSSR